MSIVKLFNRKDAHLSENSKLKKTFILPISQLDAVMISLDANDTDSKAYESLHRSHYSSWSSIKDS